MADVERREQEKHQGKPQETHGFWRKPGDEQAWNEAGTAVGALGDTAGRLLAREPREDTAFASSLTILVDSSETLRKKPSDPKRKDDFNIALGDVRYRVKSSLEWTCADPMVCNARWFHS